MVFQKPGLQQPFFPRKKLIFHKNEQGMDSKNKLAVGKSRFFQKPGLLKPTFS